MSGTLTAERDGINVTFHMSYADPEDHMFAVDRYEGTTNTETGQVEVWKPIHSGHARFVDGDTDWETPDDKPLVFPRRYRAKAYRRIELDNANSRILQGQDHFTATVTVK